MTIASANRTSTTAPVLPVLVVGGGVVGLSMALFLRHHGVEVSLVEKHDGTSIHPRARGVNTRTMELYRAIGLERAIREAGAATPIQLGMLFGESLAEAIDAPVGKWIRRGLQRVARREKPFGSSSPTSPCRITQDILEPVLANEARARGAELHFGTELTSFRQEGDGVFAELRERASGATRTVRARYLVAADGARSRTREALGVGTSGRGSLGHLLNVLFEADLAEFVRGREFSLAIVHRPEVRGVFAAIDNQRRWVFHAVYDRQKEQPSDFPPERCAELVRTALGAGDIPIRISSVLPWECAARVADTFRVGRVFLAGDAAHLMPPWGGMGANTGVADAYDLAWKLARVLDGEAGDALLDTYDAERRPVDAIAADESASNADADGLMSPLSFRRMLGVTWSAVARNMFGLPDPKPGPRYKIFGLGFQYASEAIGTEAHDRFRLDGRPGTRIPHAWLERHGARVSALDLASRRFTLILGRDARASAPELVDVLRCGIDFVDPGDRWQKSAGIGVHGAMLVRPDGVVAWRTRRIEVAPFEQALLRASFGIDAVGVITDADAEQIRG